MDTFSTYSKKRAGYKDVSETVKILEKIAAGQLHALESETDLLSQYTAQIETILSRMNQLLDNSSAAVGINSSSAKTLLLMVSGDKGLVGDLWRRLFSLYKSNAHQDLLVVGKKAQLEWPESDSKVSHYTFAERLPNDDEIIVLGKLLQSYVDKNIYSSVTVLYLNPESLVEQKPVLKQLLPLVVGDVDVDAHSSSFGYPIVEGSIKSLHKSLSQKYTLSRLRQVFLETAVSEYSARAVAMEHASAKTDEETKLLTMVYSRERRQRETQKQLERFAANNISI